MMHDPAYIKDLFSRFMAGRCTREEIDELIAYLETADDDQLLPSVEEFREAFPRIRQLEGGAAERILGKLNAAMEGEPGLHGVSDAFKPYRWLNTWQVRIAAAVVAVLAISAAFYLSYPAFTAEHYDTGNAQVRKLELDDGTRVSLNANSELRVKLSEDVREVWLNGEAFFSVAHDTNKKFIVHTSNQLSIEVLGTEFNVKDRTEGTSVVLTKGSVRVKLHHGRTLASQLLMSPGEMAEYHPAGDSLVKSRVDTSKYASWKDNLLIFDETPLGQVAVTIENHFGYTVRFTSPDLANLRFTGSNPADNLDMLLETLERSFDLSITKSGTGLLISKSIE